MVLCPFPPFWVYVPVLVSLTMFLSLGTNVARFAVIPAVLGHAVFNSVGTYIGGLFANEPMSAANAFWKGFGALMKWLGLGPFAMGPNPILAACGITVALAIILVTRGALRCIARQQTSMPDVVKVQLIHMGDDQRTAFINRTKGGPFLPMGSVPGCR